MIKKSQNHKEPNMNTETTLRPLPLYWKALQNKTRLSPEEEQIIRRDPIVAVYYARNVLNKRWPEAEEIIAQDPQSAYFYARDVVKDCWPRGEAVIFPNQWYRHCYIRDVVRRQGIKE